MNKLNNKLIFLLLCQFLSGLVFAFSTQNNLPECEACLENQDNCFNDTLTNKLTIKSRGVEYIDLKLDDIDSPKSGSGKGSVVEISYIVVSTQNDSITVQVENVKDQYILESRDSRVSCSRKNLKLYKQNEKIAIHCNNMYYDCEVMYEISLLEPQKEENNGDTPMPGCDECTGNEGTSCFESIYLPAHTWYYLYYDGYDSGTYLDFLVSSHKKDKMRVEVQNHDGLFYLVSTRRDKVRCSDPQTSVPVRWKSPRIAVYCYNNYIGCKFSVFVRSFPMDSSNKIAANGKSSTVNHRYNEKMMGYYETSSPKWSEWSEWSDCIEPEEGSKNGMGKRTRERHCIQNTVDFVNPDNVARQDDINRVLKEADIPYCEGTAVEYQNCQLEEAMEHSWQNILIFVFIISALVLTLCREKRPSRSRSSSFDSSYQYSSYNEDVVKSNGLKSPTSEVRRESVSENSPLLNTYFRRYD